MSTKAPTYTDAELYDPKVRAAVTAVLDPLWRRTGEEGGLSPKTLNDALLAAGLKRLTPEQAMAIGNRPAESRVAPLLRRYVAWLRREKAEAIRRHEPEDDTPAGQRQLGLLVHERELDQVIAGLEMSADVLEEADAKRGIDNSDTLAALEAELRRRESVQ